MRIRELLPAVAAVVLLVLGLPGTANASAGRSDTDTAMRALSVTGDGVPAPPPPPMTKDGTRLQGSWIGPYTYRNLNSGRCLDILGASKDRGAPAVQYRCVAGGVSQMWYLWHTEGDGFIDFHLIGNAWSGKCLMEWNANRQAPVKQIECNTYVPGMVWSNTSDYPQFQQNDESNFCMEVQGGSLDDFAAIVTWDCHHQAHQAWLRYNA
ncbi:RICIN domain-containing protein [Nonomuraea sp. NPDC049695]|uniref:RICIN domain-containing protein n=1 Tax=Nonomuraea sp. NPDC049695 TaxID=3154734 RepID=UPI003421613F